MNSLFVYGTLLDPQRMRSIVGRRCYGATAVLKGYRAYYVKNANYPALAVGEGATYGFVYQGLSDSDWLSLDKYEGEYYERIFVRVQSGSREISAQTYVLRRKHQHRLSDLPWRSPKPIKEP